MNAAVDGLESRAVVTVGPVRFPTIARYGLGEPEPPQAPAKVTVTIHRQVLHVMAPAQRAVLDLWRAHDGELRPALQRELAGRGLLPHCGFLASLLPGSPLLFQRHADATVQVFGGQWARAQLGQPSETDPHSEYGRQIAAEYREAIADGQPVYNHLVIHGLRTPVVYSHLLFGFTSPGGRTALLTVIDYPGF